MPGHGPGEPVLWSAGGLPLSLTGTIAKYSAPLLLGCAMAAAAQTASVHHVRRHTTVAKPAPCPPAPAAPVVPPGIPAADGPVQTAFALRYIDLHVGTGAPVAAGDAITVQYTGWLASDGTKFDSSLDRNQPFPFTLGGHQVIPGWDQGFAGMRVGGKRRLFIPYQLAYGDAGRPPVIPAKADLIFDVELVDGSTSSPGGAGQPAPPPQPSAAPQR